MSKDRIRVLLVEDSPSDAQLLCESLGDYPLQRFEIERAERLDVAIALVAQRPFDVILLDLNLPDSSGMETCKRVSAAAGQTPIIVLTGANDEAIAAEAMHLGVQDYLVKGQTPPGVIGRAISYAVERSRAQQALRDLTKTLESKVAERTAEVKHRVRQLQKLTLDMSEAEDRERKRLAEILHDDLQQILAAAKFHLGLMRNRIKDDPSLQAITAQIDHMLMEAIQKSRGLSHELSPAVLHHADFSETIRWLADQVQSKHGLVVHVRARGPVHSESDAVKAFLYRTAQEMLFNVVKHARVKEARIEVRRLGPCVCLSVSDRGRGFDPKKVGDATGFGLLSIRERIELLGGHMKIKSAKGKGSTFLLIVPDRGAPQDRGQRTGFGELSRAEDERQEAEEGSPSSVRRRPSSPPRLRVLLADDHEIVRQGLMSLLSEEHTLEIVGEAANGREAIDLAARLEPDVVIMDVSMPLIDGDEATRQIKAHLPNTRIVALSMYDQPEMRERMYRAGADSYVLKTIPSEGLLAAIRGKGPDSQQPAPSPAL
jgi:DNA-binding NarL/FixJ family response regulator